MNLNRALCMGHSVYLHVYSGICYEIFKFCLRFKRYYSESIYIRDESVINFARYPALLLGIWLNAHLRYSAYLLAGRIPDKKTGYPVHP